MLKIVQLAPLGLSIALSACLQFGSGFGPTIDGKGAIVSDKRSPGTFKDIELDGSYDVTLTQAASNDVIIHTNHNIAGYLKTEVKGDKLIVSTDANLHPTERIRLEISSPNFRAIEVDGFADVGATTPLTSDALSLDLSGSGSYNLEVHTTSLKSDVAGSGKFILKGSSKNHVVEIDGSGNMDAAGLETESSNVDVSGSGDAVIFATKRVDASIAGSGSVRYKGGAKEVHSSISGSGSIDPIP